MTLVERSSPMHSPSHGLSSPRTLSTLSPLRIYLIAYNSVSFLLWLLILSLSLHHLLTRSSPFTTLHQSVYPLLLFTESLALLECLHSLLGLTRSPFLTSFLQTFQRNLVLWGITYPVPSTRSQPAFAVLVLSWSLIEVVRYPFYAITVAAPASLPRWLIQLRYSLFIPLYPLGMLSELVCLLHAVPVLHRDQIWTLHLPNSVNFSFDWFYYVIFDALLYIPGAPYMFLYMWKQRRKVFQQLREHDMYKKVQ